MPEELIEIYEIMVYPNSATISIKKRFSIDYKKIINKMQYERSSIVIKKEDS